MTPSLPPPPVSTRPARRANTWREALFNRRDRDLHLHRASPRACRSTLTDQPAAGVAALGARRPEDDRLSRWSSCRTRGSSCGRRCSTASVPPLLGRRRGWMLVTQLLLIAASRCSARSHPQQDAWAIAYLAAGGRVLQREPGHRARRLPRANSCPRWSWASATRSTSTRIGSRSWCRAALALILADSCRGARCTGSWRAFMLPGIVLTLVVDEPKLDAGRPAHAGRSGDRAVPRIPSRAGWREALLVLAFIFLYKLGDSMAAALATAVLSSTWASPGDGDRPDRQERGSRGRASSAACWRRADGCCCRHQPRR